MDDAALGNALRSLRIRRRWRQTDLASRAAVSRSAVSRAERGHVAEMHLASIRAIARELDARLDLVLRWRGSDLDRLVNARHSALHEAFARTVGHTAGWTFVPEVTFSFAGERGIIDVLGYNAAAGALLVVELKSELVDIQEHLGTLDRKIRLAPRVGAERGWRAGTVGAWLILAAGRTNRRRLDAHRFVLRSALPSGGREVNMWLAAPRGPLRALSQVPYARDANLSHRMASRKRVRCRTVAACGRSPRSIARQ